MMDGLHFTEEDIREQLVALGYQNIPPSRLKEFARDLEKLIEQERSYSNTSSSTAGDTDVHVSSATARQPFKANTSTTHEYQQNPSTNYHSQYGKENEQKPDYQPKGILKKDLARQTRKPPILRKVVRKRDGKAQVFDESTTESEADEMTAINDQLGRLPLNDAESYTETDTDTSSIIHEIFPRRPRSSRDLYSHRPSGDEEGIYKPHLPRSFIRPSSAQCHYRRNNVKTDPVSRHQMYQSEWHSRKVPGEKNRKDLRWNIRERMMYKDDPVLPKNQTRVYVPNSYQVPTEKKRQALRWAVRTDLANRQMPQPASAAFQL
ncbi:centriolar and ciliogenesis-associated protein HYLS1-like isoform X2 [Antedon mediterranea]